MNLERYSRQVILPDVGVEGQQTLLDSRVLIVGAGGLGCAAAQYLAGGGVGHLTVADADRVELSNLQRQLLHDQNSLGMNKAESAARRLSAINPEISVEPLPLRMDAQKLKEAAAGHDLVVDASDNFDTRHAVNAACLATGKALVSGAAIRHEGQVMLITPGRGGSACYACVFPPAYTPEERCEDTGILGPMVGVIGSYQALLAMRWLLGLLPQPGRSLLLIDGGGTRQRTLTIKPDPNCPACGEPA